MDMGAGVKAFYYQRNNSKFSNTHSSVLLNKKYHKKYCFHLFQSKCTVNRHWFWSKTKVLNLDGFMCEWFQLFQLLQHLSRWSCIPIG